MNLLLLESTFIFILHFNCFFNNYKYMQMQGILLLYIVVIIIIMMRVV